MYCSSYGEIAGKWFLKLRISVCNIFVDSLKKYKSD